MALRPESRGEFDPAKFVPDADFAVPDLSIDGYTEGWRAWELQPEIPPYGATPRLESASHDYFWRPRQLARATCEYNDEHVPGEDCGCGFYSAKSLDHLLSMGYWRQRDPRVVMVGQIANWGKVIEGSQGWRSEKAYPVKLYCPFEHWKLGAAVSKAYGVPVRIATIEPGCVLPDDPGKVEHYPAPGN